MSRATRLNVAVTANTAQFERQMAKTRAKLAQLRKEAGTGLTPMASVAGMGGAGGALLAGLGKGSPIIAAIGGLTMALQAAKTQEEKGRKNIEEMALLALDPIMQQQALKGAQFLKGEEGKAGDIVATQAAFTRMDRQQRRELESLGVTDAQLNELNTSSIAEFVESLVEISRGMSQTQRLAVGEALGGTAGEMFMRAGSVDPSVLPDISQSISSISPDSIARAMAVEQGRQETALNDTMDPGFWASLWNEVTAIGQTQANQLLTDIRDTLSRRMQEGSI